MRVRGVYSKATWKYDYVCIQENSFNLSYTCVGYLKDDSGRVHPRLFSFDRASAPKRRADTVSSKVLERLCNMFEDVRDDDGYFKVLVCSENCKQIQRESTKGEEDMTKLTAGSFVEILTAKGKPKSTPQYGTILAPNSRGEFVVEIKGKEGDVGTFKKECLKPVLPNYALFTSFAGGHYHLECPENTFSKGDLILAKMSNGCRVFMSCDSGSSSRKKGEALHSGGLLKFKTELFEEVNLDG